MARGSDEDRHAWKETPAIYADNFEISVIPDAQIARIAFGEFAGRGRPAFLRTAVAMPISDAKTLVKMLGDLIRDMEEEEAKKVDPKADA
jgi:hypothetical protein